MYCTFSHNPTDCKVLKYGTDLQLGTLKPSSFPLLTSILHLGLASNSAGPVNFKTLSRATNLMPFRNGFPKKMLALNYHLKDAGPSYLDFYVLCNGVQPDVFFLQLQGLRKINHEFPSVSINSLDQDYDASAT